MLDINGLKGKRIGYIPSAWIDPIGTTGTIAAEKAALRYLIEAGATIVEMGVTVGGADSPPQTVDTTTGDLRSEGWMQYIDAHPELSAQGFKIKIAVDVNCSIVKTWMDTAGADHLGVDAIVYPGLFSEISVNDGGGADPASAAVTHPVQ
jgi:amidase